ncbi:MAG: SDR family oxidoreductase [Acidobacteria bacterium]|nr:SDR family oxidoreductase [Acidobacteriota bacterium]
MRFSDKVAVVTGGANGIGRAIVERFLSEGARVAVLDTELLGKDDALHALAPAGALFTVHCDICDSTSVRNAIDAVVREFGRIDVLTSVAGGDYDVPDELADEYWNHIQELNLHGPIRLIRESAAYLKESQGAIVLISSVNGLAAFGGLAYSSAKAGLSLVAKNLAVTYGGNGIRVNVVAPGTIRTRVWDGRDADIERLAKIVPLGRVGTPEDIAAAVAFLASADAAWITGVTLPVDGGVTVGPLASIDSVGT